MTTTSTQQSYVDERLGLLGRKVGMMRVFTADGDTIPVTVLDVSNNRVSQVKTTETDGYNALQLVFGEKKASRVSKPEAGHLAKAGVVAGEVFLFLNCQIATSCSAIIKLVHYHISRLSH